MRLHYFSFSFFDNLGCGKISIASVYIGYPNKLISLPRIAEAKRGAGVSESAKMLSCCYLGKMKKDEVNNLK